MAQAGTKGAEANEGRPADDLAAEIEQLKADIAALTEQLKLTREHSYGAARKVASEGMEQLRAQGEAALESLREKTDDLEQQLTDRVREKPITSLAIAAGVGFLLALMSRR
jgi:ElaB/YqjD/DUF883 family membrane-anchored ribosome-binding protein